MPLPILFVPEPAAAFVRFEVDCLHGAKRPETGASDVLLPGFPSRCDAEQHDGRLQGEADITLPRARVSTPERAVRELFRRSGVHVVCVLPDACSRPHVESPGGCDPLVLSFS